MSSRSSDFYFFLLLIIKKKIYLDSTDYANSHYDMSSLSTKLYPNLFQCINEMLSFEDHFSFARTCKSVYQTVIDQWVATKIRMNIKSPNIHISSYNDDKKLIIKSYPKNKVKLSKFIRINEFYVYYDANRARPPPTLTQLIDFRNKLKELTAIPNKPVIKKLEFANFTASFVRPYFKQVESIKADYCTWDVPHLGAFPNLKVLHLDSCDTVKIQYGNKLEHLSVIECNEGECELPAKMNHLKSLCISWGHFTEDSTLKGLYDCPELKSIEITPFLYKTHDGSWKNLKKFLCCGNFPKLESISVDPAEHYKHSGEFKEICEIVQNLKSRSNTFRLTIEAGVSNTEPDPKYIMPLMQILDKKFRNWNLFIRDPISCVKLNEYVSITKFAQSKNLNMKVNNKIIKITRKASKYRIPKKKPAPPAKKQQQPQPIPYSIRVYDHYCRIFEQNKSHKIKIYRSRSGKAYVPATDVADFLGIPLKYSKFCNFLQCVKPGHKMEYRTFRYYEPENAAKSTEIPPPNTSILISTDGISDILAAHQIFLLRRQFIVKQLIPALQPPKKKKVSKDDDEDDDLKIIRTRRSKKRTSSGLTMRVQPPTKKRRIIPDDDDEDEDDDLYYNNNKNKNKNKSRKRRFISDDDMPQAKRRKYDDDDEDDDLAMYYRK